MSFASLPKHVITCVYSHFIETGEPLSKWITALPLLAICRQWRENLVPLVYSQVYFTSGSKLGTGFNTNGSISLVTSGKTNIDIIKQMNMSSMVTKVCMVFYYTQYFETLVADFEQLFDFMSHDWSNVNSIDITIDSDICGAEQSDKYVQMGKWFSGDLPKAMPNVFKMNIVLRNAGIQSRDIIKDLVSNYALQLKSFNCTDSKIYIEAGIMDKLKELTIDLNATLLKPIPYVLTGNLEVLNIQNCSGYLDLGSLFGFSCNSGIQNNTISFHNLRELSIGALMSSETYNARDLANSISTPQHVLTNMYFPKLKIINLCIKGHVQFYDLFLSGRFIWPNVNFLVLEISSGWKDIVDNFDFNFKEKVQMLAKNIRDSMPKVEKLTIKELPKDELSGIFVNSLLDLYGNKLTHFNSNHSIRFNNLSFQSPLTHLDIELNNNDFVNVATACAGSLKILNLRSVPQSFSWEIFQENEISNYIDFTCLEMFRADYMQGNHEFVEFEHNMFINMHNDTSHEFQVNCPKLRKIKVTNASFSALHNLLAFGSGTWSNVRSLNLHFCHVFDGINDNSINAMDIDDNENMNSRIEQSIDSFGYSILNAMNSVIELNIDCQYRSPYLDQFSGILNSGYSGQLQSVSSTVPIPTEQLEYSSHLKKLFVKITNSNSLDAIKPNIDQRALQHMSLDDTCAGFDWSWFDNNCDNSNLLSFENLKSFKLFQSLNMSTDNNNIHKTIRNVPTNSSQTASKLIYAPDIQKFDFSVHKSNVITVKTKLYFKNARQIRISGPVNALPTRENPMSNILDDLSIDITEAKGNDSIRFYDLTNSWFGCRQPAGSSSLVLSHIAFELDPESTRWLNVRELVINCSLKVTTLFSLLPQMKHLVEIKLGKLVIDKQPVCVDSLDSLRNRPETVIPLSKSLESIYVVGYTNDSGYDTMAAIVTHLLLASTSLKQLRIKGFYIKTSVIVSQFKAYYPHIRNVEFTA